MTARSFEGQVVRLCLIATVTALTFAFAVFQWLDWRGDRADLAAEQVTLAQIAAPDVAASVQQRDPHRLAQAVAALRGNEHVAEAIWFPVGGAPVTLVAATEPEAPLRPSDHAGPLARFEDHDVVVGLPVYGDHGRKLGELMLLAEGDEILETLWRNTLFAAGLALAAVIVSSLLARALARRSLRPLQALNRGIEAVRRSRDFTDQVPVVADDEFGRLTANFNLLLRDLETYDTRLQATLGDLTAARDAADSANLLKSQFLANMSHEIRTPLNGVLGMAQAMGTATLEPAQRERLEVIQKSGAALLTILNDILDLAKIEAGKLEIEAAAFDMEALAVEACEVFAPVAAEKGLGFDLRVEPAALGAWEGDAVRVRQLLQNLVSNALKFTQKGGVEVVVAAGEPEAPGLALIVSDTGIGISPQALPKLFDKFVQADSSTTRRFGGTGLGLAICHRIVELMGGEIAVESREGEGTTVRIALPLPRAAALPSPVAPAAPVDLSALRVLAAEDNPTNRLVLKTLLDSVGVEAVIVVDGEQAVQAWAEGGWDIVLMDVQMPVLDGVAATRQIRALEARRGLEPTRIVALTANAMRHQVDEYLGAGFDGHVAKPLMIAELLAALSKAAVPSAVAA
jgi:signal transduction histidine kinase